MSHEHTGACCGQLAIELQTNHQHVAADAGRLCCMGACSHPEHHPELTSLESQIRQLESLVEDDDEDDGLTTKKRKRGNRSGSLVVSALSRLSPTVATS